MNEYIRLNIWKATKAKLLYLQALYLKRAERHTLVELVEMLVNEAIAKLEDAPCDTQSPPPG